MKIIRKLLLIICILCAIGAAIIMYPMHTAIPGIATPYILDVIAIARNTYDEMYRQKLLDAYNMHYNKNNDFQGIIAFESNIISERVMQAEDNDKYLRRDFNLKRDIEGTVFMDADCTLDSQNITMYGHYVYYNTKAKFSSLHLLVKEKNYEKNKYITFQLKDQVRRYEVFAVYYYDWENEAGFFYNTPDFQTGEGFQRLISNSRKRSFYKIDVDVEDDDNILTLQTCVRNRDDLRLIVVAKEIERK